MYEYSVSYLSLKSVYSLSGVELIFSPSLYIAYPVASLTTSQVSFTVFFFASLVKFSGGAIKLLPYSVIDLPPIDLSVLIATTLYA